ncbi:CaiB/BaiF CoA transferase family protein [Muricoccus radiodurans]|uniref:CaiB/BaiF CoA transferase family protein n=1 Tax=Muricoccus radiodurans TaxID=2231721 RepID=UPI003CF10172
MSRPLDGIRVIDLTQIYNGPYATFLMAMAGADVIKVEPPQGEHLRKRPGQGSQLPFLMLNSGKRSVVLDLKAPEGRADLLRLVRDADVLVENYRPGVMERLGLSLAVLREVNPRLIVASSSGYGSTGPYRDFPAMDLVVQAMSGVMGITGEEDGPPMKAGPAMCDFGAGVHLYGAIVTALLERERTGRARAVEVAMLECVYPSLTSNVGMVATAGRAAPQRTGNRHGGLSISPYNVYPAADGYIAIICNHDGHWLALADFFGQGELARGPRYATKAARVAQMQAVDDLVAGWTGARGKDELFRGLGAAGVPCAPVKDLFEVMEDPQLRARQALVEVDHPEGGRVTLPTSPLVFEDVPRDIRWPSRPLGADQHILQRDAADVVP